MQRRRGLIRAPEWFLRPYCYTFFPKDGLKGRECASVERTSDLLTWEHIARRVGLQLEADLDDIERCYAKSESRRSACV